MAHPSTQLQGPFSTRLHGAHLTRHTHWHLPPHHRTPQLGSCLPTIVPRISEVLNDPHPKVQAAANEALREVGVWGLGQGKA